MLAARLVAGFTSSLQRQQLHSTDTGANTKMEVSAVLTGESSGSESGSERRRPWRIPLKRRDRLQPSEAESLITGMPDLRNKTQVRARVLATVAWPAFESQRSPLNEA